VRAEPAVLSWCEWRQDWRFKASGEKGAGLLRDIMKALAMLTQIGISMMVPILLCVWIGKYLDGVFDSGVLFLVIFVFLGVGSSFRTLYMMTVYKYKKKVDEEQAQIDRYKGRSSEK